MDENTTETQAPQPSGSKMPMMGIGLLLIVLIGGGIFFLNSQGKNQTQNTQTPTVDQQPTAASEVSPTVAAMEEATGETKTFNVTGQNFSFSVKEIRVKKGDKVKIVYTNKQGFHDFVIDEFNARTPQIQAGTTEEIEFVADKAGTFEYYCSVGQHRQNGMKGNLIVE